MARVFWTDKARASVLEIGRYIIDRSQSRQRDLRTVVEQIFGPGGLDA